MSVIATIRLPADEFELGAALGSDSHRRVELERVVPVGRAFVPYLVVSDDDVSTIEASLERAESVASCDVVDSVNGEALLRVEWDREADGFFESVIDSVGTILEALGEGDTWRFQLRFEKSEDLTEFYRQCVDRDIGIEVESVHNPGVFRHHGGRSNLTDTQRETLCVALEEGYYDVPRRINLVGLAGQLGVSDTAVSQRLRRATATVLRDVLADVEE